MFKLMIKEVNASRFDQYNGEYPDYISAADKGSELCRNGNVEAFEIWERRAAFVVVVGATSS